MFINIYTVNYIGKKTVGVAGFEIVASLIFIILKNFFKKFYKN